jgi:hypothetical protein
MKRILALVSCAIALAFVSGTTLISAENGQKIGKATVRAVQGQVTWSINGGPPQRLHVNEVLDPGATVMTGPDSHADLSVNGVSSVVRISADSKIQLSKMTYYGTMREGDRETYLNLQAGEILGNVKKISGNSRYEIETPHGVAGIRGTDFQITIALNPDGTYAVTFTSVTGQVIVSAVVNNQTVVHILNTGESWTPGYGDVKEVALVDREQALAILSIIEQNPFLAPPPPPPPPNNPFPTGGPPEGQAPPTTTPSDGTVSTTPPGGGGGGN